MKKAHFKVSCRVNIAWDSPNMGPKNGLFSMGRDDLEKIESGGLPERTHIYLDWWSKNLISVLEMSDIYGLQRNGVPSCHGSIFLLPSGNIFDILRLRIYVSALTWTPKKHTKCMQNRLRFPQESTKPPASCRITNCPTGMSESTAANTKPEPTPVQFSKTSRTGIVYAWYIGFTIYI